MTDGPVAPDSGPAAGPGPAAGARPAAESPTWRNRTVLGMGLTSLLSDLGHEASTAVLPMFLVGLGAPPAALGAIEGTADAAASGLKLVSGWLGDRVHRRKPIVVAGYALTGIATGLIGLSTSWIGVLGARVVGWMGRGVRGPLRDAMLTDSVAPEVRGRAFGFERAGDTLGAVLGPILALLLLRAHFPERQIMFLAVVPGLLAAVSFAVLVRERPTANRSARPFRLAMRDLPPRFRYYLIGVGAFGLGDFAHSLLILRATQALEPTMRTPGLHTRFGGLDTTAAAIAIGLYALHNVIYAAASFPVGALADRFSKPALLAAGYVLAALVAIGFIFAVPTIWNLAILFGAAGLYIAVQDTLERAIAADLLPADLRSTGFGALATVNGLGDLVSSVVVGLLWTVAGPAAGFGYAAVLALLGAGIVWRMRAAAMPR